MSKRKRLLLTLAPVVALLALLRIIPSVPWPWAWGTGAVVLGVVAIVVIDRRTRVQDDHRRAGRCECGFDLRATPPADRSLHSFGVDEQMAATKTTIVCPECGKAHVVWTAR